MNETESHLATPRALKVLYKNRKKKKKGEERKLLEKKERNYLGAPGPLFVCFVFVFWGFFVVVFGGRDQGRVSSCRNPLLSWWGGGEVEEAHRTDYLLGIA